MHRLHLDDLKHSMKHDHFAYLRRWLEQQGAVIVVPDDIWLPDGMMPGTFTTRRGRWGQDEPYPPYERDRQFMEDLVAKAKADNRT